MTTYMSFGAGVQSTALFLLTVNKDPRLIDVVGDDLPEAFVFADTGDERQIIYSHLTKLSDMANHAGVELCIVRNTSASSLSEHVISKAMAREGGIDMPPVFVLDTDGKAMPVRRGCTSNWKVKPLDQWARARYKGGPVVTQWYGISLDELGRMRIAREKWRKYRYPLVEMRWSRGDCINYLQQQTYLNGEPVVIARSSCVYCPYHSLGEWKEIYRDDDAWSRAVAFDEGLRAHGLVAGLQTESYLLRGRYPLSEFDPTNQLDLLEWSGMGTDNDCTGMCGV